jgi:hypothetical protein
MTAAPRAHRGRRSRVGDADSHDTVLDPIERRSTLLALLALACAAAAAACGNAPAHTTVDIADLSVLAHAEEVWIGSTTDPDSGFSRIRRVRVSATGEVYVLDGSAKEVRVFGPDGRRLRVIGGPGEGPGEFSFPGHVLDSLIAPRLRGASIMGVSERELESALREAIHLPEFRAPVRVVHAGSDGSVWLQLNTADTDGLADWVLIGRDGSPRGRLRLPVRTAIHHSALPAAWAVELDELDVPWLIRLRIE